MISKRTTRHKRWFWACLALFVFWYPIVSGQNPAKVRVGYFDYWPLTHRESGSPPSGFMVELFDEAARREGLSIEWVEGKDPSNRQDQSDVDLWPLHPPMQDTALAATEPWWTSQLQVVSRTDRQTPSLGRFQGSLAVVNFSAQTEAAKQFFPNSRLRIFGRRTEVEDALCSGEVDAALMGEYRLQNFLLERPSGCRDVSLRFLTVPGAHARLSITSRPDRKDLALRIRARLNDLAADGTMARLVERYPSAASGVTLYLSEFQHERSTRNLLLVGIGALSALLVLTAFFLTRLRQDIRRRQRVAARLRLSEQAVEQSIDGIAVISPDGTISRSNGAFASMHGYEREELVGRRLDSIVGAGEPNWLSEIWNEGRFEGDRIQLRKDGEAFTAHIAGSVLKSEDGSVLGAVIVAHDKTREQQLEWDLRQSQKMEAVGRLAGGIAHDFNNLLTIINGYCDLFLSEHDITSAQKQKIGAVRDAGERAATLTRQLLYVSRKQVSQPRQISLNESVGETLKMLRRLVNENIQLVPEFSRSAPEIVIDPGQLNQILLNLVVNSRDAMPQGGVISFSTAAQVFAPNQSGMPPSAKAGAYAVLTVRDTGTGITPEVRRRMFEPFFTTKAGGTGLGLATVESIVRDAGGWIEVESRPSEGATFRIGLPLCAERRPEPPAIPKEIRRTGKGNILLVEDQLEVRLFAAHVLRSLGYKVFEAEDGPAALQFVQSSDEPLDLLITDLVMPKMGGREVAERVCAVRPSTKVIFISGYPDSQLNPENLQFPALFLPKPFTVTVLSKKVAEVLEPAGTVLVVDDEADLRAYLRSILEDAGYQVIEAGNGNEALHQVEQKMPSVILMDLAMPGKEGIETIRQLQQTHPQIHIIAMSGAFGAEILQVARSLGARTTLQKPISAAQLLEVLPVTIRPIERHVPAHGTK